MSDDDEHRDGDDAPEVPQFLRDLQEGARRLREAAEPTLRKLSEDVQRIADAAGDDVQKLVDAATEEVQRAMGSDPDHATAEPAAAVAPPRAALLDLRAWVDEHGPVVAVDAQSMRAHADEAHVGNWAGLRDEDWHAALAALRQPEPVPIAWVAPAHVVAALVRAPGPDERAEALTAHAAELTVAARSVLGTVSLSLLAEVRASLEEAWAALDAGLVRPAHVAGTAALEELVSRRLAEDLPAVRASLDAQRAAELLTWPVTSARMRATWAPVEGALRPRRATAGAPTQAEALRVLLVATAATRELQFVLSESWRTAAG